jgi:hypothetical protein
VSRGRRAQPAEAKALKGNPGKRKLALENIGKRSLPMRFMPEPPVFLTQDGERDAFRVAFETLPQNIARASDVTAMGRWAAWLHVWVTCKLALDGKKHWYESESKHGKFLREHPLSKRMDKAEAHLVTLEDRLCLNIVARNNVIHRLFNMPGAHPGGMFIEEELPNDENKPQPECDVPAPEPMSPLGWMQTAGKPN